MKNQWVILAVVFFILAIAWDESRAMPQAEADPICTDYAYFALEVANARDMGMPEAEVHAAAGRPGGILKRIIEVIYANPDTDAIQAATEVYQVCMYQLVSE